MQYKPQYSMFKDLLESGTQTIFTKDINKFNIDEYFYSLRNILLDGIELEEVHRMMINIVFVDNISIRLSIFDFMYNLMMWQLIVNADIQIQSIHLFFPENISRKAIKEYIDNIYIDKFRTLIPLIDLNNTIDLVFEKFRDLRIFQQYLANSLCFEDTIDLMNTNKEFYDTMHFDISKISLEDVKDEGMKITNKHINIIKNSDHCLRDSFRTGEGINAKQYREVAINIGTKPDGNGSIFPKAIQNSFMNGGLQTAEDLCIDSSVARVAQILSKNNVGSSGEFARKLELNNQDTFLNPDPNYICDTKNFQEMVIDSETKLSEFDLRYYRENPNGVDKLLEYKRDKHLIGKKLYFRSPMTCASAARGHGICYKCYGNLAFVNKEVNVGQIAAEGLSSTYTQILLSAKHLLESLVQKMKWNKEFYDMFNVMFNTIQFKDNLVLRDYKLIIDEDIKVEEELDDIVYNNYINSFVIRYPDGNEIRFRTEDEDNLYFMPDVYNFINNPKNKGVDFVDDGVIEIDMVSLLDFDALFIVELRNNELSRTMDKIKKLIDNKSIVEENDRNSILKNFIETNMAGGIIRNSIHFEVLLMNQIRAADDELEAPDWTQPNAPYQILTLSKSLQNNRSITVRLEAANIARALLDPNNDNIHKPSISDLYFMEQPQEYLTKSDEIISDEYKSIITHESNLIEPIHFTDGTKCGIKVKKRKMTKAEVEKRS